MNDPNWGLMAKQDKLTQRARILAEIRAFFVGETFLEVDTPQRIPCNAPELNIEPQSCGNWALHTSLELCMKRLLAAGYARIFQLCHCWRAHERGSKPLPEFTMLEWYRAHSDYTQLMRDCENLLRYLVPTQELTYHAYHIDLSTPFERITLEQSFLAYAPITLRQAIADNCFEEIYTEHVEPKLGTSKPTIIYDFPVSMAALARAKPDNPLVAERFELYIAGVELANAFSELTDEHEQRQRFVTEEQQRRDTGRQAYPLPEPFLAELSNMPPAAGIALGVDRLVMLLTAAENIAQVVAFTPEEL